MNGAGRLCIKQAQFCNSFIRWEDVRSLPTAPANIAPSAPSPHRSYQLCSVEISQILYTHGECTRTVLATLFIIQFFEHTWGRILEHNWNKRSRSFPLCYSQLPILTDFTPIPLRKSSLKLVCYVHIVYGNPKPENSQDYDQKPQRNCTFINSASGHEALV
jgi:hypothetical protein